MITTNLDVGVIREQAKQKWLKDERKHRVTLQDRIEQSVAWWLVIIAAVFFVLSAPHTAAVFDLFTRGWGWIAPLGVEVGMLYVAFSRHQATRRGLKAAAVANVLGLLVSSVAVVVNGVGAFASVVSGVDLSGLPFAALLDRFSSLPATSQAALFLVPFVALIIPLGAFVAGDGLARLILDRREYGDLVERDWPKVQHEKEFEALRDASILAGNTPTQSVRWALNVLRQDTTVRASERVRVSDIDSVSDKKSDTKVDGKAARIKAWLDANPERIDEGSRKLASEIGGVTHETVNQIRNQMRQNGNGNHERQ